MLRSGGGPWFVPPFQAWANPGSANTHTSKIYRFINRNKRSNVEREMRYREHSSRKHDVPRHPDRYYFIRIAVDGVMRQEALGWESEGITLEKARLELAK